MTPPMLHPRGMDLSGMFKLGNVKYFCNYKKGKVTLLNNLVVPKAEASTHPGKTPIVPRSTRQPLRIADLLMAQYLVHARGCLALAG